MSLLIDDYNNSLAQDTMLSSINDLYEQSNDLHVAAYKLHLEKIDGLRNSQSVSEREYLDRKHALWEKYYANNVELANQAKEAKLELLEEEKDYLESVAEAASSMFDDQNDNLEKQRDSIVSGYKNQIDIIEDKKKALEEQLNTLEEERKEQELLLNLQKEQYALERAKNQKSVLQYVDGQMIFTTKDSDIRDAHQAVDNAKFEITKHNIEKQISAYDDQIDKLNDLIDSTNKYYDNEVDKLTQLQSEWEKALQIEERVIKRVNFESMFGEGSITKLLNGDLSMVKEWKEAYFGTLKDIDITSQGQMGEITEQYAKLAGIDLSKTTAQTKEVASQFDVLKDSVDSATSAIAGTSGGTTQNNATGESLNGEEGSKEVESTSANSLVGAIDASYQTASQKLPAEAEMMNGLTESTTVAMTEVNSLGEAINALPDEKTITINVVTNGSVGGTSISGNAYADGTRHAEKGLAIVGEEKPEVILTNDDKVLLATKPTLLNMEGGETVFDGDETAKMIRAEGLKPISEDELPLLKAFRKYTPDEIMSRFGMNYVIPNYSSALNNANAVMNSNVVNRNVNSSPTVNLNVNCPGVTSTEVANQITTILHREISGIALEALQEASITR